MEKKYIVIILLFSLSFIFNIHGQSFSVNIEHTELSGSVGKDLEFKFTIKNISKNKLVLYLVKKNNLLEGWTSYFCLTSCFGTSLDSLTTSAKYGSGAIAKGDSLIGSLHINMNTAEGSGTVELKIGVLYETSDVKRFTIKANTTTVSVEDDEKMPAKFSLNQNYPNPFNPSTKIGFNIPKSGYVLLNVYNLLGKKVKTLLNKEKNAGSYEVIFNAKDLPSGVYYYKLTVDDLVRTKKMMLLR